MRSQMNIPKTKKRWRRVDGILLLDKPSGISSNQALQRARHHFCAEKGGHTGALDPLATGMLPLCFGEATKIAGWLLGANKAYEAVAKFGVVTDSADADGQIVGRYPLPLISDADLQRAFVPLIGKIQQVPPIFSALKREGEPLYAKARRGEVVEIDARPVEVHCIKLLEHGDDWAKLYIECGSGTYIRSLVRDLGEALGCGAHVQALRRLWVEPFRNVAMQSLEALLTDEVSIGDCAAWRTIEEALAHHPVVHLDDDEQRRVRQGQSLRDREPATGALPSLALDTQGRAVALMESDPKGGIRPNRVFAS
jgi:tRNA pseudouridine55 synthase